MAEEDQIQQPWTVQGDHLWWGTIHGMTVQQHSPDCIMHAYNRLAHLAIIGRRTTHALLTME